MSSARVSRTSRRRAALVVGFVSSGFFLWLVLRDADFAAVVRSLRNAQIGLVILAAVVVQGVYAAQAARWRALAATVDLSVPRFYVLVLAGIGTNNVLPLRVGDLLRARWLATTARIPTGRALGSVFRDRAFDVLTLVVALVVVLPIVGGEAWVERIMGAGVFVLALLAFVVAGAAVYARRRPRGRRESRSRARSLLRDGIDEVASPIGRRRIAAALGFSVVAWGAWGVAARLVGESLGFSLSVPEVVFVASVVNLGVVIPSSPGFIGTYQWLAVSALGAVGVRGGVAIAFSLVMQAIWYVPTTIAGGAIAMGHVHREATRAQDAVGARVPSRE